MTDRDDFRGGYAPSSPTAKGGFVPGTVAAPQPQKNVLTVGLRSDGQVCIISDAGLPGANTAHSFIMPRDTARWIATEILRLTSPSESDPHG